MTHSEQMRSFNKAMRKGAGIGLAAFGKAADRWVGGQAQRYKINHLTPGQLPAKASFIVKVLLLLLILCFLTACSSFPSGGGVSGDGNMGRGPSVSERAAMIAAEPRGDFFYGRRYYVPKTRFWGYLRKPGQSWNSARLVIFNESQKRNPDRLPEDGPAGRRYGFDQNYEYRLKGRYTGRTLYEPNSNQFLPEFLLSDYTLLDKNPGWLFTPADRYDPKSVSLRPLGVL